MKKLLKYLKKRFGKIRMDDPMLSELIAGAVTRRAVLLALKEGKQ